MILKKWKLWLMILGLFLFIIAVLVLVQSRNASAQDKLTSTPITPIPQPTNVNISSFGKTPTPDGTQVYWNLKTQIVRPSSTVIFISKHTDLSPNVSYDEKLQILISHPDGTNELILIGPIINQSDLDHGLPSYVISSLNLKPGDKILSYAFPPRYQRFAPGVIETLNAPKFPTSVPTTALKTPPSYP